MHTHTWGKNPRTSEVLQGRWFAVHSEVWPMQIKTSTIFCSLKMALIYQGSEQWRVIWEWLSSCRQCSCSFPGCHDPQWQQSYLGKTAWLSLPWPITGAGRGRQHRGCVFSFSPCCPSGDGGGERCIVSRCEMACSWVVQDSCVLAPLCVCHRQNPYFVSVLFFWSPWEWKARTLGWMWKISNMILYYQYKKSRQIQHWSQQGSF